MSLITWSSSASIFQHHFFILHHLIMFKGNCAFWGSDLWALGRGAGVRRSLGSCVPLSCLRWFVVGPLLLFGVLRRPMTISFFCIIILPICYALALNGSLILGFECPRGTESRNNMFWLRFSLIVTSLRMAPNNMGPNACDGNYEYDPILCFDDQQ